LFEFAGQLRPIHAYLLHHWIIVRLPSSLCTGQLVLVSVVDRDTARCGLPPGREEGGAGCHTSWNSSRGNLRPATSSS
jgi:hypothetical protein